MKRVLNFMRHFKLAHILVQFEALTSLFKKTLFKGLFLIEGIPSKINWVYLGNVKRAFCGARQ